MKADIHQRPMRVDRQHHVYEASKVVLEAKAARYVAVLDGTHDGSTEERCIVNALVNVGWRPPEGNVLL